MDLVRGSYWIREGFQDISGGAGAAALRAASTGAFVEARARYAPAGVGAFWSEGTSLRSGAISRMGSDAACG